MGCLNKDDYGSEAEHLARKTEGLGFDHAWAGIFFWQSYTVGHKTLNGYGSEM